MGAVACSFAGGIWWIWFECAMHYNENVEISVICPVDVRFDIRVGVSSEDEVQAWRKEERE